jgi:hypothetical protein
VPHYYPLSLDTGGDDGYDDDFDISALADQYLDLSEHCPVPSVSSRSMSPSTDYTDASDVPDVDLRVAKRRRIADVSYTPHPSVLGLTISKWEFLRLPKAPASDGGCSDDTGHTNTECIGLSPFHHSPHPVHLPEPVTDAPQAHHDGSKRTAHWPAPPTLKFTEARKDGRSKRQALACLFCRERKIACGRPAAASGDKTCK